ncbi:MAG: restriction endonuclease subunit S [Algibacter sp.]|uniref:restriction endonuclease subunit S n=1 Tax=Algibacter sp. TaxID=1872428 RepID=UPI0026282D4B|nr:restriction endonuclease subunit S [Algibacter sp.]MDG1730396.1 restriction endonuclease subunit S [Algibacter sp.]
MSTKKATSLRGTKQSYDRNVIAKVVKQPAKNTTSLQGTKQSTKNTTSMREIKQSVKKTTSLRGTKQSTKNTTSMRETKQSVKKTTSLRGTKQSAPLIPKLRFKEFDGDWNNKQLKEICSFFSGGTPTSSNKEYYNGGIPFIGSGNIFDSNVTNYITEEALNNSSAKIVEVGDLLYALYGANSGEVGISKMSGAINQAILCIRTESEKIEFIHCLLVLNKDKIVGKYLQGGQGNLSANIVKKLKYHFPTLPEQQKIASFLSAVDEKIQQLTKKKALLEEYKKGVMQQLFSGKRRFKPDPHNETSLRASHFEDKERSKLKQSVQMETEYPDWEEAVMQDVFERIKEKNKENNQNVMSISAQMGLINQLEYFNRSVSAKDVTNYYLLKKGDFAYNKSYSKGYPMGAIKRLEFYDKGVVSTLYICFRIKENDDSTFYKEFLDHGGINKELHKIAQEGARNHGLLNMSVIEFFRDIKIPRPSTEEQIVIGKFLKDLSFKIESAKEQITQTQTFKKGLLQQLFV